MFDRAPDRVECAIRRYAAVRALAPAEPADNAEMDAWAARLDLAEAAILAAEVADLAQLATKLEFFMTQVGDGISGQELATRLALDVTRLRL